MTDASITQDRAVDEPVKASHEEIRFDDGLYPRVNGHNPEEFQAHAWNMDDECAVVSGVKS